MHTMTIWTWGVILTAWIGVAPRLRPSSTAVVLVLCSTLVSKAESTQQRATRRAPSAGA